MAYSTLARAASALALFFLARLDTLDMLESFPLDAVSLLDDLDRTDLGAGGTPQVSFNFATARSNMC